MAKISTRKLVASMQSMGLKNKKPHLG